MFGVFLLLRTISSHCSPEIQLHTCVLFVQWLKADIFQKVSYLWLFSSFVTSVCWDTVSILKLWETWGVVISGLIQRIGLSVF